MYVAPDTNIILRYKRLWDIAPVDLNLHEDITWLITPEVIRELNKIKDRERDKALRRRAGEFTKRFEQAIDAGDGRFLYAERQKAFDYVGNALDNSVADERLLADLIAFRDEKTVAGIALLTNDFNLRTRARARGFAVIAPPDGLALPEPPTAMEIQHEELRRELDALRSAAPRLELLLNGRDERTIQFPIRPSTAARFPKPPFFDHRYQKAQKVNPVPGLLTYGATKENPEYDAEFNRYKEQVAAIAPERWRIQSRFFPLALVLTNTGGLKAETINVRLVVPAALEVHEELPDIPEWPKPPQRYTFVSFMHGGFDRQAYARAFQRSPLVSDFARASRRAYEAPYARRHLAPQGNSTRVEYDIRDLAQHDSYSLEKLLVELPLEFRGCRRGDPI